MEVVQVLPQDKSFYKNNCAVLNGTLAWTLDGSYNKNNCLDPVPQFAL